MKKLILVFLLMTSVARAETYKWTDSEGTVNFSDSLGNVPAAYRNNATSLDLDGNKARNGIKADSARSSQSADNAGSVPQVEVLKDRMLKDDGIMAIITALQNDPEMQAVLSDPAMVRAIQSMDIGALTNNPAFMRLLDNPRVREIQKRMQ